MGRQSEEDSSDLKVNAVDLLVGKTNFSSVGMHCDLR